MSNKIKKIILIIVAAVLLCSLISALTVFLYLRPASFTPTDWTAYLDNANSQNEEFNVSVTSFNIRCDVVEANAENNWSNRKERAILHIKNLGSDIFGLQEVRPKQLKYLTENLEGYAAVGESRDYQTNSSERATIFYKTDKFELLETKTFWLSDNPSKISKFKDAGNNRICTYAILKQRDSGKIFVAANTHLDHINESVRLKQIEVLCEILSEVPFPMFITGDFNMVNSGDAYAFISKKYLDSQFVAKESWAHPFTYHGFNMYSDGDVIDYCFVTENIKVNSYKVDTDDIQGKPYSDHYSVTVNLTI